MCAHLEFPIGGKTMVGENDGIALGFFDNPIWGKLRVGSNGGVDVLFKNLWTAKESNLWEYVM